MVKISFKDHEAREAVKLLGMYTGYRYDPWILMGPAKASCRAHIMSVLMGRKIPKSKSGVTVIRAELYARLHVEGDTIAAREESFAAACRREFGTSLESPFAGGSILR